MGVFVVSMNLTKCRILLVPYCMKLWNSKLCLSQKQESLQPSMRGPAYWPQPIRLGANTTPTSLSLKTSIFLQLCCHDSILCTLFSTRLMKSQIADWQPISLGCTSKIDHTMRHLRISLYPSAFTHANNSPLNC